MINWPFKGWLLDDTHWVGKFKDKNNKDSWQMVTFNAPVVNGVIDGDAGFQLNEIDPNNFIWNGRRAYLKVEGEKV